MRYLRRLLLLAYKLEEPIPVTGHTLVILGVDSIESTNVLYTVLYDNTVVQSGATWSIISGGNYASIDSGGNVTINSSANNAAVTILCTYSGLTVTKNITVTYKSGTSSLTETEVTVDPETGETSTTTTTTTTNQDGSSTTSTVTVNTDENGDITGSVESETNVNQDGSSTTVITNYDENDNPVSGSNNSIDTAGNSNTQEVTYDLNGDPYVTGYIIDTTNNPNGGETITNGLDTGFIAFDGKLFTIHLKCNIEPTQQSASGSNIFVAALEPNGNRYAGFCIELYKRNLIISMASTNGAISNTGFGSRVTGTVNGTNKQLLEYVKTNGGVQTLTIDITYTPSSYNPEYKYIIKAEPLYTSATGTSKKSDVNSTLNSNSGYLPTSLANATITIGSYEMEHTHDMVDMEVLEFDVHKL